LSIEAAAVDHFGITSNPFSAGWVLRDGRMLDFSGRRFSSGSRGERLMDHRDVGVVFPEDYEHTKNYDGYSDIITDFEKETGAIRVSVQGAGRLECDWNLQLSTYQDPTKAQKRTLGRIHRACPQLWYDIYWGNTLCDASSTKRLNDAYMTLERCKVEEGR